MRNLTLVTGSSGFIGARLQNYLQEHHWDVVGWTRALGDLRDPAIVRSVLSDLKPARIMHLAASSTDTEATAENQVAEGQRMLKNLALAMPEHCQLIYTGSMAEYGRSGTFDEAALCVPDTAYGAAKYACTTLAMALRVTLGRDIRVARLFGVYGAGEKDTRLLPTLIRRLTRGEVVPLSDGLQIRDFIHVNDVSKALIAFSAADNPPSVVNVGTGVGVTVREVCEAVAITLGADRDLLRFGALDRRGVDQDCLVARIDRLCAITEPPIQRWKDTALAAECVAEFVEAGSPPRP